jgi:hypothetical protein
VASYRSSNVLKGRKRVLSIEPEGEPIMDLIIIAYTIIDKRKKDSQIAASTAIAANSG